MMNTFNLGFYSCIKIDSNLIDSHVSSKHVGMRMVVVDQGCPNSVLDGRWRCPAEFSSNLPGLF